MKYKQGGDINVGDWVQRRDNGITGRVHSIDPKCGVLEVGWSTSHAQFWKTAIITRPKSIKPAEPEDLI